MKYLFLFLTLWAASHKVSAESNPTWMGSDPQLTGTKASAKTFTQAGTFLGIEEGDYTYWNLHTAKGEYVSFYILHDIAAIKPVLDNPEKFKGKKCEVTFKKTLEKIEEGQGKTEINELVAVKWR